MNIKDNARSRRSRESIRSALLALLAHQELGSLTVSQVCREAGVNRSTFYAHYDDLWDVVEELEEEMDQALLAQFHWVTDAQSAMLERRSFLILTQQIQAHPAFYRARLNNPSISARKMEIGMRYIHDGLIEPFARNMTDSQLLPYFMAYGIAGVFEVLKLWVDGNCRESAESMADLLYEVTIGQFL